MSEKKIVGITMGDPASIGPEITVKAFADKSLYDLCNPVVVGDACVMEAALPIRTYRNEDPCNQRRFRGKV